MNMDPLMEEYITSSLLTDSLVKLAEQVLNFE